MFGKAYLAFYLSAAVAIIGTVGYHLLMKKIPEAVNPLVSIVGIYVAIVILAALMLPFFISSGALTASFKQLNWIQIGIAVCILLMEIGFLMMYRSGWDLSTGNIVTGAVINIALGFIGIFFLKEALSFLNIFGVALCIVGVILIGYKGSVTAEENPLLSQSTIESSATNVVPK